MATKEFFTTSEELKKLMMIESNIFILQKARLFLISRISMR